MNGLFVQGQRVTGGHMSPPLRVVFVNSIAQAVKFLR